MKTFISEYGLFIVGVVALMFVYLMASWMIDYFRNYSELYIKTITGAKNTEFVGTGGDSK